MLFVNYLLLNISFILIQVRETVDYSDNGEITEIIYLEYHEVNIGLQHDELIDGLIRECHLPHENTHLQQIVHIHI